MFKTFKIAVETQFKQMSKQDLFVTGISKDDVWNTYLNSFPEGSNPIFRERTEHDCQCCKQFIRAGGNVVAIVGGKLVSIWDVKVPEPYQTVANALSAAVKQRPIVDIFLHYENTIGTDHNIEMKAGDKSTIRWEHFYSKVPPSCIRSKIDIPSFKAGVRDSKEVLQRSLEEISFDAISNVLELISQGSLYRGDEHKATVKTLKKLKQEYARINTAGAKELYLWKQAKSLGQQVRIRNTVIGTLLVDISDGVVLDKAVASFEAKVAPANYKRPTALITKGMIKKAQETVMELGIEDSLTRRFAKTDDLTINNVLFANRETKQVMNVFDELSSAVQIDKKHFDKVDEVDISTFVTKIIPQAEKIELLVENKHTNNLMSLIAPQQADATPIFSWNNNFSWSYRGEVTDSMKERVKKAGGNVEGVLRFSIQWNDGDNNQNDFDAHCREPNGNLIYYGNRGKIHPSSGMLDVDIINPGKKVAVENITWTDERKMLEGIYHVLVHNYHHNGGMTGFTAQIEYDGVIYDYTYNKGLRQKEKVTVAKFEFNRTSGITFTESLPSAESSRTIWGISTHNFQNVSMIMNSPNHWDGQTKGNKHIFFILDHCVQEDAPRGFYNEFLKPELTKHRKVFEVLGSKMKVEHSNTQLSGLGFSSTQRNQIVCKVTGSFSRVIKINF